MRSINTLIFLICLVLVASTLDASTIHQAAAKGDMVLVKTLIKNDPKVASEKDDRDVTPLHFASFYGRQLVVKYLLSMAVPVDAVTKSGHTPLLWAVWRKHLSVAKTLLSKGANINAKSAAGMTALHFAVQNNDGLMVQYLLSKGAKTDIKDSMGQTAEDYARRAKFSSIISLLSKDAPKPAKPTPVVVATNKEQPSKVNTKNVVTAPVPKATVVVKPAVPERPVVAKNPVVVVKPSKPVVLSRSIILAALAAADIGKVEAVEDMLKRAPGLARAVDTNGATLVHWFAQVDWPEGITVMQKAGANVNARKKDGVIPIQVAAALGQVKALKVLLTLGADPYIKDLKGRTAESLARDRGQDEILKIFEK